MSRYEEKEICLLPPGNGFRNVGATCYFNALLQSLLSCTELTRLFMGKRDDEKFKANKVAVVYLAIIDKINHPESKTAVTLEEHAPVLWSTIISTLREKKVYGHFGNGQEDTHEAFIMLMDCWEDLPAVIALFKHKDAIRYFCFDCKQWNHEYIEYKEPFDEKQPNIESLTYFTVTPTFRSELPIELARCIKESSKEKGTIDEHIKRQITYVNDYKCTNIVASPNPDDNNNTRCMSTRTKLKEVSLVYIPQILVVLCPKYGGKIMVPFPPSLKIVSGDDVMLYVAVSQIIHSGDPNGGHYWSHSLRASGWKRLDDSSVTPIDRFVPEEGTYVVFYQRI